MKKEKICLPIDIAIPDDSNVNTKESEKLSMFEDLEFEFSRMWKLRTKIVPVTIGTLETIKKELDQKLQLLPGYAVSPRVSKLRTVTLLSIRIQIRVMQGTVL